MGSGSYSDLCDCGDYIMIYDYKSSEELKTLLDLADNPRYDVKTTTQGPHTMVEIPDELYERFLKYQELKAKDAEAPKSKGAKK